MNFNIRAIWQIWPWRLFLAHQGSHGELLPSVVNFSFKIFSSETTGPIKTKLCHNGPLVIPFQNCVRQVRFQSKMAASGEHSLTLDRMRKHIKRCSPLKPLGQMKHNLVTEVLGWSSFNNLYGRSRLDQRWPSAGDSQRLIIQVSDTGSCEPLVKDCDTLDNVIIY